MLMGTLTLAVLNSWVLPLVAIVNDATVNISVQGSAQVSEIF